MQRPRLSLATTVWCLGEEGLTAAEEMRSLVGREVECRPGLGETDPGCWGDEPCAEGLGVCFKGAEKMSLKTKYGGVTSSDLCLHFCK